MTEEQMLRVAALGAAIKSFRGLTPANVALLVRAQEFFEFMRGPEREHRHIETRKGYR